MMEIKISSKQNLNLITKINFELNNYYHIILLMIKYHLQNTSKFQEYWNICINKYSEKDKILQTILKNENIYDQIYDKNYFIDLKTGEIIINDKLFTA